MKKSEQIARIESSLTRELELRGRDVCNVPIAEYVNKAAYKARLEALEWDAFVQHADYHYFAARTLFSSFVHLYGMFCAHQCVENYLKAALKLLSNQTPQTHKLLSLLRAARQSTSHGFVCSDYAELICMKYEPFYELARYPAQNVRVLGGAFAWASGADEQTLDYFVMRMRRDYPLPEGSWDLLSADGHIELQTTKQFDAATYQRFTTNNVNFMQD